MQRIFLLFVFYMAFTLVVAQDITVKSFALDPTDLTASTHRRNDLNGDACALVKVQLAKPGAQFYGNVMGDSSYEMSVYMVYMTKGSKMLEVRLEGYLPIRVNFNDWDIPAVEPLSTYNLILTLPAALGAPREKETFTVNGVSFSMIRVEGGTFTMGATEEQGSDAEDDEKPAHKVTLSTYSIGETEVTQELWEAVMGSNPSKYKGSKLPVEQVSWSDCQKFIKKLNKATGKAFRLPTEAEWEYAARGGSMSKGHKYSGSNKMEDIGWYWENSGDFRLNGEWDINRAESNHCQTHPVALLKPNELGLYDMSGNVYEWCIDCDGSYSNVSQTNPQCEGNGIWRVCRGGSWYNSAKYCRLSFRYCKAVGFNDDSLGLRLVLSE